MMDMKNEGMMIPGWLVCNIFQWNIHIKNGVLDLTIKTLYPNTITTHSLAKSTPVEESQRLAQQVAQAAVPPVAPHQTHVRDGTRVRVRNKEYHNRRMRFYRSLDSFLTQRETMCLISVSRSSISCEHVATAAVL